MNFARDPGLIQAFCGHGAKYLPGSADGPLSRMTFGAKDLFDVEGHVTGGGNPEWLATHDPAIRTAPAITALLDAGASLVGKTHTDELAFSLNGENVHYGTPINCRAPNCIPGGSSSGSAAAVAAGLVDFAIGTDTGGSVRVPASYCGIYGFRPSHGRISLEGCLPLAPSFDTLGWFADAAALLARIGAVLLGPSTVLPRFKELLIDESLIEAANADIAEPVRKALPQLQTKFAASRTIAIAHRVERWAGAFGTLQAPEAWQIHGAWIERHIAALGPGIRERFLRGAAITAEESREAESIRLEARAQLSDLLGDERVIVMPTTPCTALPRGMAPEALNPIRTRILSYTCISGLCGLPQINIPLRGAGRHPAGLSLIGPRRSDYALLDVAQDFETQLISRGA